MLGAAALMVRAGRERLRQGAEAILAGRAALARGAGRVRCALRAWPLGAAPAHPRAHHGARAARGAAGGRLAGRDARGALQSFVAGLGRRETLEALLLEYPVMARQIVAAVDAWVTVSLELLERLVADRDRLRDELGGGREPGALVALQSEAGIATAAGARGHALDLRVGPRGRLQTKPLAVDALPGAARLLQRARPDAALPRPARRRSRGLWVDRARRAPGLPGRGRRSSLLRAPGRLPSLFYLLLATDGHFENIVPAGEHPMVVDLRPSSTRTS